MWREVSDQTAMMVRFWRVEEMVPEAGFEPARAQGPGDFESPAYTSFTTPAHSVYYNDAGLVSTRQWRGVQVGVAEFAARRAGAWIRAVWIVSCLGTLKGALRPQSQYPREV